MRQNKPTNKHSGPAIVFGMAGSYAMSNFTDNYFKQAAVLMAAAGGLTGLQSIATVLFALPFILFSAWAGWLADRAPKKKIVIASKIMELAALSLGAIALWQVWWFGILLVIFLMALQSTIFNPALNGAIPESFNNLDVPRVNSVVRSISTAAILAGMALAGPFLDMRPDAARVGTAGAEYGRIAAGIFMLIISFSGLLFALTIKSVQAPASERRPFPWLGPLESLRHLDECRKDKDLFTVMSGDAFFYGLAPIAVISIANMAKGLGYSDTLTSMLSASLMIGVAIGALASGRSTPDSWRGRIVPLLIGIALFLGLAGLTPVLPQAIRLGWLAVTLLAAGIWGGTYIIPIASFMQVRPAPDKKGKVIAASNFYSFTSMAIFGALFKVISLLPPALTFPVYALLCLAFALLWVRPRLAATEDASLKDEAGGPLSVFLRAVLSLRYKVAESGLDKISADPEGKKRPILFLPNHPALIDPVIVYSRIAGFSPRPLSDAARMGGPVEKFLVKILRVITVPDVMKEGRKSLRGVRRSLDEIANALKQGDNILLYPSGRIYTSENEAIGANSGLAKILAEVPEARVVLVRSSGIWGSAFSRAWGQAPSFFKVLFGRLPALLGNLIFFMPRRRVTVEFQEVQLDAHDKMALNHRLEAWYNQISRPAFKVPLWFWQGSKPVELPEKLLPAHLAVQQEILPNVEARVNAIISEIAGLAGESDKNLSRDARLSADLGLDSLGIMELSAALENEYGFAIPRLSALTTVYDCLLAATGKLFDPAEMQRQGPPAAWFAPDKRYDVSKPLYFPKERRSIAAAFLRQVRQAPDNALLADRSGVQSRKMLLVRALILAERFKKLPGQRLGVMLPAAPAATAVWLAAQLAGKVPVMLNWTVGTRNFKHCVELAGVTHIVTASALLEQLERQNVDLGTQAEFIALDEVAASLRLRDKLPAFLRAGLHALTGLGISTRKVPETAVILFTSGSESMPKGVPLSQENLITNAADVLRVLNVKRDAKLLAMLPPFHSFGLIVGVTLPLFAGVRAAFHPNPTESAALVFMVRDYKLTLLGATPTFLEAMLSRAEPGALDSLACAFAGAEKSPDHLYDLFARQCPNGVICEGYGITECSPVISVNRPGHAVRGSIGEPLPSVECAVVLEDWPELAPAPVNTTGMLLVRGPSIFKGYLDSKLNPFVEYQGKSWYRTGDLVQMDEKGFIFFKGRLSRFVKVAGEMVSLPQIESVLTAALQSEAPDDGKQFIAVEAAEDNGRPELTAFTTLNLDTARINLILREAGLALIYQVKNTVRLPEIPVLGTGKTDYQTLKRLLREKA